MTLSRISGVCVKMKKKILFVINSLGLGGAEKSLTSLLSTFDYSQYEVDLLMFRPNGMFLSLLPKEVNILPQPKFLKMNSFKEQLKNPKYLITHIQASIGLEKMLNIELYMMLQCIGNMLGKHLII